MDATLSISKEYKRGFNDAYLLFQYKSELIQKVSLKRFSSKEYFQGFSDGVSKVKKLTERNIEHPIRNRGD